jgi:hypothetical protein
VLARIADARSGDKGEGSNVGVMARSEAAYAFLKQALTPEAAKRAMAGINFGAVKRYEADRLRVLNFIFADSLGGGGSASLKTDAQGKTHGLALLRMTLDVPRACSTRPPNGRTPDEPDLGTPGEGTPRQAAHRAARGPGSARAAGRGDAGPAGPVHAGADRPTATWARGPRVSR